MTSLTRGPLPARVYWTRRLLVLGTVFLLVFGIARVLTSGSDASSAEGPQAVQAAGTATADATDSPSATEPVRPAQPAESDRPTRKKTRQAPVLAQPDGPCLDSDVAVTPAVEDPVAGRTVLLVLELRTVSSPACTWQVSPETLTLKVTSGKDEIWSSRQCPGAVPTRDVVVRSAVSTKVGVRWSGRRSDDECSRLTQWALPGWYHVAAAALAGEPSDVQFELQRPAREVITVTPQPEKGDRKRDRDRSGDASRNPGTGQDGTGQDKDKDEQPKRR